MAHRTALLAPALLAPALLCSMFVPGLALAASPAEGEEAEPTTGEVGADAPQTAPETSSEAVVVEAPAAETTATETAPYVDEDPFMVTDTVDDYEPYSYEDEDEDYVEKRTTLELQSGYIGFGIAPGMTIHSRGFHPNTRFELEFGGTLEHDYRDLALSFGVVTHVTPYYERKKPSFGADITATAILGPVYLRTGLGALGGLPRAHLLDNTAAGIGGVVGAGLTFGRTPMVRVGVDYDLRVTTRGEPVHTVFLALRLACCRDD